MAQNLWQRRQAQATARRPGSVTPAQPPKPPVYTQPPTPAQTAPQPYQPNQPVAPGSTPPPTSAGPTGGSEPKKTPQPGQPPAGQQPAPAGSQAPDPAAAAQPMPTFAQLQSQGIARPPAPEWMGQLNQTIQQALAQPSSYDSAAMQADFDRLGGAIDDEYQQGNAALLEELAARGLGGVGDSTIGLGRKSDLTIARKSAKTDLAERLASEAARTRSADRDRAIQTALAGFGQMDNSNQNWAGLDLQKYGIDTQGQLSLMQLLSQYGLDIGGLEEAMAAEEAAGAQGGPQGGVAEYQPNQPVLQPASGSGGGVVGVGDGLQVTDYVPPAFTPGNPGAESTGVQRSRPRPVLDESELTRGLREYGILGYGEAY